MALLIETSNRYGRELLYGIRAFLSGGVDWSVHLTEHGRGDVPPPWLARWQGHGVIARIETEAIAEAVSAVGVPVVNVSAAAVRTDFPTIISDSAAIARLAAEHLLERGLKHFGYCGDGRFAWSAAHGRNFETCLGERGFSCSTFASEPGDFANWEKERRKLGAWIESLPKPVGIMTCYDIRGQQVLEVCRELEVRVPEEVAVIGHHNDEILCDLCDPPLSSVIPNPRRAGCEAATLLDRLMRGEKVTPRVILIEPVGVATRQSTDLVAVHDPQVAAAVRLIRENACLGITVPEVLRRVPMSRTILERRFKQCLGRTPHEQILHVRIDRVKAMLATTDLPLTEVAERAGFDHPEYMSVVFKRMVGISPSQYRTQNRA